MQNFYPTISPEMLVPFRAVRGLIHANPEYLNSPDCPYNDETKAFLAVNFGGAAVAVDQDLVTLESPEDLERELVSIYSDIKRLDKNIQNIDAKDKVAWAKAVVSILERVLQLRERNLNMKMTVEFQKTIIQIMDEVCDPAQRSEITARLQRFA